MSNTREFESLIVRSVSCEVSCDGSCKSDDILFSFYKIQMELPDDILDLIRQFSRPCVSKEARDEYNKIILVYGPWPRLKRAMVTPAAIKVVRDYNLETELIHELELMYRETPLNTPHSARIRSTLRERYEARRFRGRDIRVLLAGEAAICEWEKRGGYTY